MASIWVLGGRRVYVGVNVVVGGCNRGVEERERVGCWLNGGGVD
jgi:hypothetical protein